jgi:lipopolysaccharide export system permease protein
MASPLSEPGMNKLDRYIARTLLGAVGLVMSVLLVLGLLFLFIGEQGDIGNRYGAVDALLYSLMSLPQFALQAFPAGALIGALLGIGVLARSHEITIMRAAGMSKARLALSMLGTAAVLVGIEWVMGEYLAPPLGQLADEQKAIARYDNFSFAGGGGVWIRDGNTILNVQQRASTGEYGGVLLFELAGGDRLARVGRAEHATASPGQPWQLYGYSESRFSDDSVSSSREPQRALNSRASADFLRLAGTDPEELALRTLYNAMRYLGRSGLEVRQYAFAFWSRIAAFAGVFAALLFALPFGFGSLRSAGTGARTTLGLAIGILYFFLQRLVESGGLVFNLDPLLAAWVPTALLAIAAGVMLARAR